MLETVMESALDQSTGALANGGIVLVHHCAGTEPRAALVARADLCDPVSVNVMATQARGLICLALPEDHAARLKLSLLPERHSRNGTSCFTVSIEASSGVTTGISAADRARTIAAAVNPAAQASDIHTPGHVFPVITVPGGTLAKPDLTEAAADLCAIAGGAPMAVFAELLNIRGDIASRDDMTRLCQALNLPMVSVAEIVAHRRRTENIVQRTHSSSIVAQVGGAFDQRIYRNTLTGAEHVVLVKGPIPRDKPTLTHIHSLSLITDVLRCENFPDTDQLARAMQAVADEDAGVIVLIREIFSTTLTERIVALERAAVSGYGETELRDYGVPAQILAELGVSRITLLANEAPKFHNLKGFGLEIAGHRPLEPPASSAADRAATRNRSTK